MLLRFLLYSSLIIFISCSSNKTASTYSSKPIKGQAEKMSYGPRGKIIYGKSQTNENVKLRYDQQKKEDKNTGQTTTAKYKEENTGLSNSSDYNNKNNYKSKSKRDKKYLKIKPTIRSQEDKEINTEKAAKSSLTLAVIAVIIGLIALLVGMTSGISIGVGIIVGLLLILLSIISIIQGYQGLKSTRKGIANAGIIISMLILIFLFALLFV